MALPAAEIWKLRVWREVLRLTADDVSLSFFWWSKDPGNAYTTFFPTAWLPAPDDRGARANRSLGRLIFERVASPFVAPYRTTLGDYGDGLSIPAWNIERPQGNIEIASYDRDPADAARDAVATLDIAWLRDCGTVDPATSQLLDTWLAEVIAVAERPGAQSMTMDFAEKFLPMCLWMIEVYDDVDHLHRDIWWPDRVTNLY